MIRINWKVRLKNPVWWGHIAVAIAAPIFAYTGLSFADMTSWAAVHKVFMEAISNPYIMGLTIVAAWNAIYDPTTKGISDSQNAMTYQNPR